MDIILQQVLLGIIHDVIVTKRTHLKNIEVWDLVKEGHYGNGNHGRLGFRQVMMVVLLNII